MPLDQFSTFTAPPILKSGTNKLRVQHHINLITFGGKLSVIPEEKLKKKQFHRVLDVGCGTGIWAIDYGDEHPESQVIGADLSPQQPSFAPPNVTFEIDDLEERWLYHQSFDYIHAGMMTSSFKDYPKFFRQAFEFTTPGGYIECSDVVYPIKCDDGTLTKDHALYKWSELLLEASIVSVIFSFKRVL